MPLDRWAQIEELFYRAVDSDPLSRAELLDEACRNDPELRSEVEALLACDRGASNALEAAIRVELRSLAYPFAGKTVSHYRILEGLGSGGMGTVYCAQDVKLSRRVAVKFLSEESATDPAALRRFEREALSASALEHPNICSIYEFGEHEGQPFIVMPLLEGMTVEQQIGCEGLERRPLQVPKLLDLATQVLKGLEAAHSHGIIHRDIKPGNILITCDGQAKILDFGVAKLTYGEIGVHGDSRAEDEPEPSTIIPSGDLVLSRTGILAGTVAYMSPEQVRGERVDARTDIFSLGLVLYEMATGKRAFGGSTLPVLQEAVLSATPKPVRGLHPDIPIRLENIITKAIEKDREARYQTAAEMRADLETLQRQLAPKHLPRAWAAALAIGATLFVAITVVLFKRQPQAISVTPEIKLRQLTSNSSENPVIGGQISPNGKYLAYSDTRGLHIKVLDTSESRTVSKPEALNDQGVTWEVGVWFPDSTRFLVNIHPSIGEWSSVNTSIWAVSVLGGVPTKLRDHAVLHSVSPDGLLVSFGTNKGELGEREIWLMGPNGEQPRKFQETSEGTAISAFGWLPGGRRYAYIFTEASGDTMLSRDLTGGDAVALFRNSELQRMNDFVWLHDGRLLYSLSESEALGSACNYWTTRLDFGTGKRLEDPRRLTNWPTFCVGSGSATSDDKRMAFAGWSGFMTGYIADLEAGGTRIRNLRHFTLEEAEDFVGDWTADGKTVIVGQNRGDHYGLYKQSIDSDTPEPVVSSVAGGVQTMLVMSPDDKWAIAFIWPIGGGLSLLRPNAPLPIVRIPIAGGTPETILQVSRPGPFSCARPPSNMCVIAEITDDHKQMVVSAFDPIKGRGPELTRFDLDRDVDVYVDVLICDLSPDATQLAITRSPESPIEIHSLRGQPTYVIPSQKLGKIVWIKWAADRKGLFVTRQVQGGSEILYVDLQGNTRSLYTCVKGCYGWPSPDGRRLAINDTKQSSNMWMMENF